MKKFQCDKCNYSTDSQSHLTRHSAAKHEKEERKCPHCDTVSKSAVMLEKHIELHHKAEYKCNMCEVICTTYNEYQKHRRNHLNPMIKCDLCDTICQTLALKDHVKRKHATDGKKFKCTSCDHAFVTKSELNIHSQIHIIDRTGVKCELCDFISTSLINLKSHIKNIHTDGLPTYKCEHEGCAYITKYKKDIKRHIISIHETVICDICGAKFKSLEEVIAHKVEKHSEMSYHRITENIYKCKKCPVICSSINSINRHITRHHPVGATHTCDECAFQCIGKEILDAHIKKQHFAKTCTCKYCGKAIANSVISEHIFKKHSELDGRLAKIFAEPKFQSEIKFYHTESGIGSITKSVAQSFNINFTEGIQWWIKGVPSQEIVPVTPISCDNFVVKINPPESSWKDGKCSTASGYISILDKVTKAADITTKITMLCSEVDARVLTYHVYCPDAPLDKVIQLLNDKLLYDSGFRLKDIDIKCDFACTVTDKVATGFDEIERRKAAELRGDVNQGIYRVKDNDPSCIELAYPSKLGYLKLKIYNKFVQSISSGGSRKLVGCNMSGWMCNDGPILNKAVADLRTQERGLTRIEITITDKIPTQENCADLIEEISRRFLPDCNWTSINDQFNMLEESLKHTLCTYNCLTGEYVISRWCNRTTGKVNGYKSKTTTQNMYAFIQLLYNCSLEQLPIDIIMISPEFEKQRLDGNDLVAERIVVPMNFNKLLGKNENYLDGAYENIKFVKWFVGTFTLNFADKVSTLFVGDCVSKARDTEGLAISPINGFKFCHPSLLTTGIRKNGHDLSNIMKMSREDFGFKKYTDIIIERKCIDFRILMEQERVIEPPILPIDISKEKWTPLRKISVGKYNISFITDGEYTKKPGIYVILENENGKSNWATCTEYEVACLRGRTVGSEINIGSLIKYDGNMRCNIIEGPFNGGKIFTAVKPAIAGGISTILNLEVGSVLTVKQFWKETVRKKETYVFIFNEYPTIKYDSSGFLNAAINALNNIEDLTFMSLRIKNAYYESNNKRYNIEITEMRA